MALSLKQLEGLSKKKNLSWAQWREVFEEHAKANRLDVLFWAVDHRHGEALSIFVSQAIRDHANQNMDHFFAREPYHMMSMLTTQQDLPIWVLEWLQTKGRDLADFYRSACRYGRIDMLDWLIEHTEVPTRLNVDLMYGDAIEHGYLAVLTWLESHGFCRPSGSASIAANALYSGHVGMIERVILHWKSPLYTPSSQCNAWEPAVRCHTSLEVADWLFVHGFAKPEHGFLPKLYQSAMLRLDTPSLGMVIWLYEHGCAFDDNTFAYAFEGWAPDKVEVCEWLETHRCPVNSRTLHAAVGARNLGFVVRFTTDHPEWVDTGVVADAIRLGSWACLGWFLRGRPHLWTPNCTELLFFRSSYFFEDYWWTWAYEYHRKDFSDFYTYDCNTLIWRQKRGLPLTAANLNSLQMQTLNIADPVKRYKQIRELEKAGIVLWKKSQRILQRFKNGAANSG